MSPTTRHLHCMDLKFVCSFFNILTSQVVMFGIHEGQAKPTNKLISDFSCAIAALFAGYLPLSQRFHCNSYANVPASYIFTLTTLNSHFMFKTSLLETSIMTDLKQWKPTGLHLIIFCFQDALVLVLLVITTNFHVILTIIITTDFHVILITRPLIQSKSIFNITSLLLKLASNLFEISHH